MSFFGPSQLEKQVINITSESLRDSDVAGNLELADQINRSGDDGKEILKFIFKRIKHKNAHVQLLALNLLDLCVKNCHTAFHQHLGTKDNLKFLSELGSDAKTNPMVRDLTLTLLETWNEAFTRPHSFQLPIFGEFYMKLKRKGVEFPARDMAALSPVITPQAGAAAAPPHRGNSGVPVNQNAEFAYQQQLQQQYGNPFSPPNQGPYPGVPYAAYGGGGVPQPQMQLHPYNPQMQPPPAQGVPMGVPQAETPEQRMERKRAKLSDKQKKKFTKFTYLSQEYIAKCKNESHLTLDYIKLLRDLCSAAESREALAADPLAANLQRLLVEVRNRYTKLILELGDIIDESSASAVEFLIDLSIRMIDYCRIILDYHKLRCDGVQCSPPEINMPRALLMEGAQDDKQPGGSSSSSVPANGSKAAPVDAAGAGAGVPQMQLFDMPAANPEEDEKQVAAAVFAQHRNSKASPSQPPSASPVPAAAAVASASPAPTPYVPPAHLLSPAQQAGLNASQSPPVAAASSASSAAYSSPPKNPAPAPRYESPSSFQRAPPFVSNVSPAARGSISAAAAPVASPSPGAVPVASPTASSPPPRANNAASSASPAAVLVPSPANNAAAITPQRLSVATDSSKQIRTPFEDEPTPKSDHNVATTPSSSASSSAASTARTARGANDAAASASSASASAAVAAAATAWDALGPMRVGEGFGQDKLRRASQPPVAAGPAGGPVVPEGPSVPEVGEVQDQFLNDMMSFTIAKEGQQ